MDMVPDVGTIEIVFYFNNTDNGTLLHCYLINFVLNTHPRFRQSKY